MREDTHERFVAYIEAASASTLTAELAIAWANHVEMSHVPRRDALGSWLEMEHLSRPNLTPERAYVRLIDPIK